MDHSEDLPLREGILRWCDPTLVAAAQQAEARGSAIRPPSRRPSWMAGARMDEIEDWNEARSGEDRSRAAANQAWARVFQDLRRRLEQGELILTGVKARPSRGTEREILPGAWAADFRFKAEEGAIEFDDHRYVAVRLGLRGNTQVPDPPKAVEQHIQVELLDDETILRLLHENAERAALGPESKLFPPGKLSLIPFIKRELQFRAAEGALLPTLVAECKWLEEWIKGKVPNSHTPTAKTISTMLKSEYWKLKTRSKPSIQSGVD